MRRIKIGVVGCGRISGQYLENLVRRFPFCIEVVACADIVEAAGRARAEEFGVPRACTVEALMADSEVEIVVNLTAPAAHFEVSEAALSCGKHVYVEKPFTITRDEGLKLLKQAAGSDLRIGGAPDTFLGAGLQTCRKLIDDGWIGAPVAALALMATGGGRLNYYRDYRGPAYDMGPYYLTALVTLLGPVTRAAGVTTIPFPERRHLDPKDPEFGATYQVEIPSTIQGVMEFAGGVTATITTISEASGYFPRLEIYGTDAVLTCNDPNGFGGPVYLQPRGGERREMPLLPGYKEANRGLGVADMAAAIQSGRPHRASGELCYHVLDIILALHDSSRSGRHVELESRVDRPAPFLQSPTGSGLLE
ncbi:MAG TPA: Gfo/Idh/MocA family oxidoreductase [Armatimonadota bacterium]|nr:Gfo/Idh/MocA family oxidoreductase [Armatimonadota bacterium]